jgi:long-chain fatty acid transport protein
MKQLLLLLIVICPFLARSQGFQVNLQGQKQQAMGGAASAIAGDGSSLFFNPGATSFLEGNSFSAGVSPVIAKTSFTEASSAVISKTNSPAGYPFTGYLVFGKKDSRLKFGLASYTPFGSTISWQDGWTGRFVITSLKLNTVYFQPTASYKISDKLGIGAGFVYGTGGLSLHSDMPITDEDGNYSTLHLSGKGHGFGFNAGVYYQATEKLSFGVNYRSALKLKIEEGSATFNVPPSMSASFPSGPVSTNLDLPKVITVATAYKASKSLTLAFDATMVGWKSYDTLNYDFRENTPAVSDIKLSRNYKNTFSYRVGADYAVNERFAARLGLKYLSTPVGKGHVTPEVPDANHFSYSTGIGYKISKHLTADASFTFEHIKREDNNAEVQLNGKYDTRLYIPGLSISYSF